MVQHDVQVVVSKYALRVATIDQFADEVDNGWAVWSSVGQVAQENKSSILAMTAILVVAQMSEKRAQGVNLAVDIAHDVERAVEKRLNEGRHGQ